MIVLDYIKTLKGLGLQYSTFKELLEKAKDVEFKNKQKILEHFENIKMNELGIFLQLKYDAKKMYKISWDSFYTEARGLLINWVAEEVVLYPFDKFFELEEHKTTTLSVVKKAYANCKVIEATEKIDGSLTIARYYNGAVVITSSGAITGLHVDIAQDILRKNTELLKFIKAFPGHTIIMELKNTQMTQLVKYNEDSLTVIGIRDMQTNHLLFNYEIRQMANDFNISIVETKSYTLDEMLSMLEDPSVSDKEGYVLRVDDLMVKLKTKNYILASRYQGEPERNFNMLVEGFNEDRLEGIKGLIREDYITSYEVGMQLLNKYYSLKMQKLLPLYESIPSDLNVSMFIWKVRDLYPDYAERLVRMKKGLLLKIDKEDIKYLRKFATYLTCVGHVKYAELNNIPLEQVETDIAEGRLQYIHKFDSPRDYNKPVYIIHKWQFVNLEDIQYT